MEHKQMIIFRGLPGSGKSTMAANMPGAIICSADDYMVNMYGEYEFDFTKLKTNHRLCRLKAEEACIKGETTIIIDNTNIQHWEFEPYLKLAKEFDYPVTYMIMEEKDVSVLFERGTHNVPIEKLTEMCERWED